MRRELPQARSGKGAALNTGFRQLLHEVGYWPADKVLVGIMDADGRLDPQAPDRVAAYFAEADVGAVQVAVRINNRHDSVLARLQAALVASRPECSRAGRAGPPGPVPSWSPRRRWARA